jgi:pimeloyl-ACP methyl ester carboxylesterase
MSMARIEVNGVGLAYEVLGEGDRSVAITPGGRYSKDTPGVRPLAEKIAEGGYRVLIWDRPNAGEADISFAGESEALMCVEALSGLIKALDFGPTLLVGGSAGSRQSIIMALRHPEQVKGLYLFWMSGGTIGLSVAAMHYCGVSGMAAVRGGMEKVAELPIFEELLARNPGNRERLLQQDPKEFVAKMQAWAKSFFPQPGSPVPGYSPADFASLKTPAMILRSGEWDIHHTRATSEDIHRLIPGAHLVDPPWGDNEWNERLAARDQTGETLFSRWPLLAPQILDFFKTIA